jgi:hypothetical protein
LILAALLREAIEFLAPASHFQNPLWATTLGPFIAQGQQEKSAERHKVNRKKRFMGNSV